MLLEKRVMRKEVAWGAERTKPIGPAGGRFMALAGGRDEVVLLDSTGTREGVDQEKKALRRT